MSRAAISCGHEVTADASEAVLRAGGTAVDAVIAGALAAMVAEPVLAGLLGGGFCMVSDGARTRCLDFFVQTPRQKASDPDLREVTADFGPAVQGFHVGAGTIATPGVAAGLTALHGAAGRMPLAELAEPAIAAARQGVVVTPFQAELGGIVAPILRTSEPAARLFCHDGAPMPEGHLRRNPDFADLLEVFAIEGARFVMEGEVAAALLALTREGGHLTPEDLKRYRPIWREPLRRTRGDAVLSLNSAPSLGGLLIAFPLELLGQAPLALEIAEAFALTNRARAEAGDRLLDPGLCEIYRAELTGRQASTRGTTHISVIDDAGRGAALTLSNGEGAGLIAPGTGIMPNNMLGEEDLVPEGALGWERDSRLASMMCPMAVRWPDGRLAMLGSGGSNRIRTALTQVLLHLIDREHPLGTAIDAPRLHVEGAHLDAERTGLGEEDITALAARFEDALFWDRNSMFFGGVHGVMSGPRGVIDAAGDQRRAGVARVI